MLSISPMQLQRKSRKAVSLEDNVLTHQSECSPRSPGPTEWFTNIKHHRTKQKGGTSITWYSPGYPAQIS